MHRDTLHDIAPAERQEDTDDGGYEIRRRPVLAATGTVAGIVLSAGCLSNDTGSGDGANDPGEETTETSTENKDTETTTETATETSTETADGSSAVPQDMQEYAAKRDSFVKEGMSNNRYQPLHRDERNQFYFTPVDGAEDTYRQITDVWLQEDFPALADHDPESLVEETTIENGMVGLVHTFSNKNFPFKDRVNEHVYHVQQGPDTGTPYASITVNPTFGTESYERAKEKAKEDEDTKNLMPTWQEQFGDYLKDNLDIHA